MDQKDQLTLCGSAETVASFFTVCIHNILYQREIYPACEFQGHDIWGANQMISNNTDVLDHIKLAMDQVQQWLQKGLISRLVLAIVDTTDTAVERWEFNIEPSPPSVYANEISPSIAPETASLKAVLRQIAMSATFLPVLRGAHSFYIAVVEHATSKVPSLWAGSKDRVVFNAEEVDFSSAETGPFKIKSLVQYQVANTC